MTVAKWCVVKILSQFGFISVMLKLLGLVLFQVHRSPSLFSEGQSAFRNQAENNQTSPPFAVANRF